MKISTTGYVTIKQQYLLGMVTFLGVFSGQTRLSESGITEAEFLCIQPGSNCETIWATREQIT